MAFALYLAAPEGDVHPTPASVWLWVFVVLAMFGVIAGNIRGIALMTTGHPADRAEAVGTGPTGWSAPPPGSSFLVTSVISGLLVGPGRHVLVLLLAMALLVAGLIHLGLVTVDESRGRGRLDEAAPTRRAGVPQGRPARHRPPGPPECPGCSP